MKRVIIILLSFAWLACSDELEIDPQQAISTTTVFSSDANVKRALLGAYDGLSGYNANLNIPSAGVMLGGDMQIISELMASGGEITWVGTFNFYREIFGKLIPTNNPIVRDNWTGGYYTINICNNILAALALVNEEDRNRIEGETLFIRGTAYFELVKLFAKPYSAGNTTTNLGVPIVLTGTTTITEESEVPRATVEQVYQRVIEDLTDAESLLPESNGVFANKVAAAAMLSRVYLQQEDFVGARDAANRAIEYNQFQLTGTFAEAFNNTSNSVEDVFAFQVSAQDGDNNMQLFWSIPAYGARDGDVEVNQEHLALYDDEDDRLALFYLGAGAVRSGKWRDQFTVLPVIRLAEMYLTRAEANVRLGTSVGDSPLNDINLIRQRVSLPELTMVTLDDILRERKLELAHEGQGLHDLKRLRAPVEGLNYNDNRLVLPIPQREINANRNLVQNEGYN